MVLERTGGFCSHGSYLYLFILSCFTHTPLVGVQIIYRMISTLSSEPGHLNAWNMLKHCHKEITIWGRNLTICIKGAHIDDFLSADHIQIP